MSIKALALLILLVLSSVVSATTNYYPSKFDDILTKKIDISSDEIKKYLRTILIRHHADSENGDAILVDNCSNQKNCYRFKTLSYNEARKELFGNLHLKKDGQGYYIKDVYCDRVYRNEKGSQVGPGQIPSSNILNCEHTWPQSRFNSKEAPSVQKTDLHHLFPTDSKANSIRGNNEFAEVRGSEIFPMCTTSYIGSSDSVIMPQLNNHSSLFFEPPDEHKGNVARALFYFSIRYLNPISALEETFLRKWHLDDPTDEEEIIRNDKIFEIQSNRNPFIDHPELVDIVKDF